MRGSWKLGTDARGNYKRDVGWPQKRFYLGRDEVEAQRRVSLLERLWSLVVIRWQRRGAAGRAEWDEVTAAIGLALARGDVELELPVPAEVAKLLDADPPVAWLWLREMVLSFPLIRMRLHGRYGAGLGEGMRTLAQIEALEVAAGGQPPREKSLMVLPAYSLHAALDEYAGFIRKRHSREGVLTGHGAVALKHVALLKAGVEDVPLDRLDAKALDAWQRHFERRPMGKRGRLAAATCVHILRTLFAFLRWLDRRPCYGWRLPADYERRKAKVEMTQEERAAKVGQVVKVFAVEQLAVLYEYARPWERALLLLALNCGFGAAEIATLQRAEIFLDASHPHYHKVGNWIRRLRAKTDVYGEWRLWPETVAAVRFLERTRPESDRPELLLAGDAGPLWFPTDSGNPNPRIPAAWLRLLTSVGKDHPDFPKLSFKYLRKTAATMIRRIAGGEVASLFLAHGKATGDDLLEVYAQRPFAKVFKALRRMRRRLAPMFAGVADSFGQVAKEERSADGDGAGPEVSPAKIRRIKRMRAQGFKVARIALDLGVSEAEVRRQLKQPV